MDRSYYFSDYYFLLGLTETALPSQVEKAYQEKLDSLDSLGMTTAENLRGELEDAYQVLSSPERRKAYNEVYHFFWDQVNRIMPEFEKKLLFQMNYGDFSYKLSELQHRLEFSKHLTQEDMAYLNEIVTNPNFVAVAPEAKEKEELELPVYGEIVPLEDDLYYEYGMDMSDLPKSEDPTTGKEIPEDAFLTTEMQKAARNFQNKQVADIKPPRQEDPFKQACFDYEKSLIIKEKARKFADKAVKQAEKSNAIEEKVNLRKGVSIAKKEDSDVISEEQSKENEKRSPETRKVSRQKKVLVEEQSKLSDMVDTVRNNIAILQKRKTNVLESLEYQKLDEKIGDLIYSPFHGVLKQRYDRKIAVLQYRKELMLSSILKDIDQQERKLDQLEEGYETVKAEIASLEKTEKMKNQFQNYSPVWRKYTNLVDECEVLSTRLRGLDFKCLDYKERITQLNTSTQNEKDKDIRLQRLKTQLLDCQSQTKLVRFFRKDKMAHIEAHIKELEAQYDLKAEQKREYLTEQQQKIEEKIAKVEQEKEELQKKMQNSHSYHPNCMFQEKSAQNKPSYNEYEREDRKSNSSNYPFGYSPSVDNAFGYSPSSISSNKSSKTMQRHR